MLFSFKSTFTSNFTLKPHSHDLGKQASFPLMDLIIKAQ